MKLEVTTDNIGDDICDGIEEIAAFLRVKPRRAYYLCEQRQIPAFKLCGRWQLRKSTHRAHVARLEAEAISKPTSRA